jgi:predicted nucleic acid-binding protein
VWIRRQSVTNDAAVRTLHSTLGEGEREGIVLAQELGAVLLVDDPDARDMAARLGILCLGSLGILREAQINGMIPIVKPHLDALRVRLFHLSDATYQTFLQQIGKA